MEKGATKKFDPQVWIVVFILLALPLVAFGASEETSGLDFTKMLGALKDNVGPLIQFAAACAYIIGGWLIFAALVKLKMVGQSSMMMSTHGVMTGALVKLLIGVVLIYLPSTISVGEATIWGKEASSLIQYTSQESDPFGPAKQGVLAVIKLVGYVSFIHGLVILSRSGDQGAQPGTVGKGFVHMIGGILAINIIATIRVIANSLGFVNTF